MSENQLCTGDPFQQPAFKRRRWLRGILDHIRESDDLNSQKERLEKVLGYTSPALVALNDAVNEHNRKIVELEELIDQSYAEEPTPVTEEPHPPVQPL